MQLKEGRVMQSLRKQRFWKKDLRNDGSEKTVVSSVYFLIIEIKDLSWIQS